MLRSLFIAATGMEAQKLNMDVISNNLANVNTVGFKKSRADFQELLYQDLRTPGLYLLKALRYHQEFRWVLGSSLLRSRNYSYREILCIQATVLTLSLKAMDSSR